MNDEKDLQHLEDKIDDFRNAVHDKVLGYGAYAKGILTGLFIASIIVFLLLALGIYTLNPISTGGTGGYIPNVPQETTPFPTVP